MKFFQFVTLSSTAVAITAIPAFAFGATFPAPLPTLRSVGLQFSVLVAGQAVKSPVLVPADTDFTLSWKSAGVGCVSNWTEGVLSASGSSVGSLTTGTLNRPFVITCYGRGAAQSATAQVTVGVTDLSVASFSIVGLKRGRAKDTYLEGPYTLKATIRNLGKLPNPGNFKVKYTLAYGPDMKTSPRTIGEMAVNGIAGGQSKALEAFPWSSVPDGHGAYFQVCADSREAIAEAKEDNNCSKVLGPYKFSAKP